MIRVMAVPQEKGTPAWSVRLAADLDANDQAAKKLVAELTEEHSSIGNRRPALGVWGSVSSISASLTKSICRPSPRRSTINRILRSSRLLPDGSGAGLFAALSSRRRSPSELRLRRRSGPRRALALPFSNAFWPETNPAGNLLRERAQRTLTAFAFGIRLSRE